MKNFKTTAQNYGKKARNRDSIVFMIIGAIVVLVIFLLFDGIKSIINMHSLENWSDIFSILGVLATLSAVGVAFWIPKQIAQQQNKIELYEKRYHIYSKLKKIIVMRDLFYIYMDQHKGEDINTYYSYFLHLNTNLFDIHPGAKEDEICDYIDIKIMRTLTQLPDAYQFLFGRILTFKPIEEYHMISNIIKEEDKPKFIMDWFHTTTKPLEAVLDSMEELLELSVMTV